LEKARSHDQAKAHSDDDYEVRQRHRIFGGSAQKMSEKMQQIKNKLDEHRAKQKKLAEDRAKRLDVKVLYWRQCGKTTLEIARVLGKKPSEISRSLSRLKLDEAKSELQKRTWARFKAKVEARPLGELFS
jgi:hypothetical protein